MRSASARPSRWWNTGKSSPPPPSVRTLSEPPIVSNPLHILMTVGEAALFTSEISFGAWNSMLPPFNPIVPLADTVIDRWLATSAPDASESLSSSGFSCRRSRNPTASGSIYRRFLSFVVKYLWEGCSPGLPAPLRRTPHTARSPPPAAPLIWIYTRSPFSGMQYARFPMSGCHGYQYAPSAGCCLSISNPTFTCSSLTSSTDAGSIIPAWYGCSYGSDAKAPALSSV